MDRIHLGHANLRDVIELPLQNKGCLECLFLEMGHTSPMKKGMESLKKVIASAGKLRKIKLGLEGNGLVDEYMKDFFRGFMVVEHFSCVKEIELQLGDNYLTDETIMAFDEGVKKYPALIGLSKI